MKIQAKQTAIALNKKVIDSLTWKSLESASTLTNEARQLKEWTCKLNKTVEQS